LIFVVNAATPKAKITYEAAVALSQHGTVAPVTLHHRTDFAASMIDGRTVMEVDPERPLRQGSDRALGLYFGPAREEFPPHRLLGAGRLRGQHPAVRDPPPASAAASSASKGRDRWPTQTFRLPLLRPPRPQGRRQAGHAPAGLRQLRRQPRGSRLERHGPFEPAPVPAPVSAPEPEPVSAPAPKAQPRAEVVSLPRPRALPGKAKAAFTLRLDPDRHLKLRLACALNGRSAQQLVTEALDEYLASRPEVGALAERVPAEAGKRSR
jgi:hypothetical protein